LRSRVERFAEVVASRGRLHRRVEHVSKTDVPTGRTRSGVESFDAPKRLEER
jgi:hypothetical protein